MLWLLLIPAAIVAAFALVLWLGFKCDHRIYLDEVRNSDQFT